MPYRRLPSLLALRAFEAVARNGSMKKAAQELNVTPGAVSQLVKKLEDQMACRLLHRANRGLELTSKGVQLQSGLTDAFLRLREAVDAVSGNMQKRTIRVSCGPAFAAKWLVPRLHEFIQAHPDMDIRLQSHRNQTDINNDDVDIGIKLSNEPDSGFRQTWLDQETLLVVAAPEFIARQRLLEPKDVLRVPILSETNSDKLLPQAGWANWFRVAGLPAASANRGVNFGDYEEQAIDGAVAGVGVVLARKALASKDIQEGRLVCPFGPEISTGVRYQIACRQQTEDVEQVGSFRIWLEDELQRCLSGNRPEKGVDLAP